jgi:serine/threonine-protein kinase SRPK3
MFFRRLHQSFVAISRVLQIRLTSSMASPNPGANEPRDIPHFTFSEEPLGLPASEGFGYFQGGPGLTLGPDCRFTLQAKLGFGTASSVWLAKDRM